MMNATHAQPESNPGDEGQGPVIEDITDAMSDSNETPITTCEYEEVDSGSSPSASSHTQEPMRLPKVAQKQLEYEDKNDVVKSFRSLSFQSDSESCSTPVRNRSKRKARNSLDERYCFFSSLSPSPIDSADLEKYRYFLSPKKRCRRKSQEHGGILVDIVSPPLSRRSSYFTPFYKHSATNGLHGTMMDQSDDQMDLD